MSTFCRFLAICCSDFLIVFFFLNLACIFISSSSLFASAESMSELLSSSSRIFWRCLLSSSTFFSVLTLIDFFLLDFTSEAGDCCSEILTMVVSSCAINFPFCNSSSAFAASSLSIFSQVWSERLVFLFFYSRSLAVNTSSLEQILFSDVLDLLWAFLSVLLSKELPEASK